MAAGGSAAEAPAICKREPGPIHLVLSDVAMPQVIGWEFAARIETLRPGTEVLFMSGRNGCPLVDHALPNEELLLKPFNPDDLARRIRDVLGTPSAGKS